MRCRIRGNPKFQDPNPKEIPVFNNQKNSARITRWDFVVWFLEFAWDLGFGIWDLGFRVRFAVQTRSVRNCVVITFLNGTLTSALPTQAIVDVRGVGYEVFIPLSSYDK